MLHIGEIIRTLRDARGWTQRELAAHAGVHKMTVSELERGVNNYRRATIERVARALDTTADQLMTSPTGSSARDDKARDTFRTRLRVLGDAIQPEHWPAALEALAIVVTWSAEAARLRLELETLRGEERVLRREAPPVPSRVKGLTRRRRAQ